MKEYKLTKIEATNSHSTTVQQGESVTGILFGSILKIGNILEVQNMSTGQYITTSVIKEINNHPTNENIKVIKTTYSIYHLELL